MEAQNNTYCVYTHTNKQNGKIYVGQTKFGDNPNKRWRNGEGYAMSVVFYRAIKKYGWDEFDHQIIESGLTSDEANHLEESLIQQFDSTNPDKGYNVSVGGESREWTELSKLKMAKSLRGAIRDKHSAYAETELRARFDQGDKSIRECTRCGMLFEVKSVLKRTGQKRGMGPGSAKRSPCICPDCRNDSDYKSKNIVKTCVDCGTEFVCNVFATATIRCKECRNEHLKQIRNLQNKRRRGAKKDNLINKLDCD